MNEEIRRARRSLGGPILVRHHASGSAFSQSRPATGISGLTLLTWPAEAQEHRFEDDPIMTVRENFVACDVLGKRVEDFSPTSI
jgi:hypothetical protein